MAARVQSQRVSLVAAVMCEVQFELIIHVGPNSNGAVVGTSGNHLLLNADVETKYGFAVET